MRRPPFRGNETITRIKIDFINLWSGKGIFRSFEDLTCVGTLYEAAGNLIYYFGDLDYEGIGFMRICQQILVKCGKCSV